MGVAKGEGGCELPGGVEVGVLLGDVEVVGGSWTEFRIAWDGPSALCFVPGRGSTLK